MAVGTAYVWRGGKGVEKEGGSSAQIIGERLAEIESQHGTLKPELVVSDARSSNSPLHRFFEWDDTKAAEAHRLNQAADLIRKVYVKRIGTTVEGAVVRAFVNLKVEHEGDERDYESIVSVMSDEMKRARLLKQAREELQQWRQRYQNLQEFTAVFEAIEEVA